MPNSASERLLRTVCHSLKQRVAAGERHVAQAMLAANPSIAEDEDATVELIYTEYVELDRIGQRPDLDGWRNRFPDHAARLTKLAQLHDAMADTPLVGRSNVGFGSTGPGGEALPLANRFGKYEVIEEIARGGMGVVYRARDIDLDREVALKIVLSGVGSSADEVRRFRAEAETAAKLRHPNIVPIYEIGESNDRLYLAFEYVSGGTLAERIEHKPISARQAAEMVQSIASAIDYAHSQGVVHRDLKPNNILVDNEGIVKVTDFGLAKRVDADQSITHAGAVVGTPCYMSPEQARGKKVGPAADVYSLGVILYQMLTGRVPFSGVTTAETLEQVQTHQPVPLRQLVPTIPRDLETICLKCLEKSIQHRYPSASELAGDLKRFASGEPIHAKPVTMLGQIVKSISRTRGAFPSYQRWSRICFSVAPIPAVILLAITLLYRDSSSFPAIAIATTVVIVLSLQIMLSRLTQEGMQHVPMRMQRHARNVFLGNMLGQATVLFFLWLRFGSTEPRQLLLVFPITCVMLAIVFWSLASDIGIFHVMAVIALMLSVAGALMLDWSPFFTSLVFLFNFGGQGMLYHMLAKQLDQESV